MIRMGWKGTALGKRGDGDILTIKVEKKRDRKGIGAAKDKQKGVKKKKTTENEKTKIARVRKTKENQKMDKLKTERIRRMLNSSEEPNEEGVSAKSYTLSKKNPLRKAFARARK